MLTHPVTLYWHRADQLCFVVPPSSWVPCKKRPLPFLNVFGMTGPSSNRESNPQILLVSAGSPLSSPFTISRGYWGPIRYQGAPSEAPTPDPHILDVQSLSIGDYLIVKFEPELFPGVVLDKHPISVEIKCMGISGQNWKRPKIQDLDVYTMDQIKDVIVEPQKASRYTYKVPELAFLTKVLRKKWC